MREIDLAADRSIEISTTMTAARNDVKLPEGSSYRQRQDDATVGLGAKVNMRYFGNSGHCPKNRLR